MDNLKNLKDRPASEKEDIARAGGIASGQVRRRQRSFKEIAIAIVSMKPSSAMVVRFKELYPDIQREISTVKDMLVLSQVSKAIMKADTLAFCAVKDLIGDDEEPDDNETSKFDLTDFEACCEACGYPPPYKKQIEMADFVFAEDDEPRLLLGARKYGKTDYAVIVKSAQMIALYGATIILVTKEQDRVRELALEIGRCLECLGITEFKRKSSKLIVLNSNKTKEPNLKAISIGSKGFRGRHPKFAILDDPITPESVSKADRKKAKAIYDELLKLTKRVRILGQPVHKKDLYQLTRKKIKVLEVPYGSIPELDADLDVLRMAGVDESSINASYFLKIDDVSTMPFADIELTDAKIDISQGTVCSIDPSHEGGDTTAMTIVHTYLDRLLIVGFAWPKAWYDCLDEIIEAARKYNIKRGYFENNALGDEPIRQLNNLKNNPEYSDLACLWTGFKSLDNKEAKIQNAGMFLKFFLLSRESNNEYKNQLIDYEVGADHDDAPDSLANWLINTKLMETAKRKIT
ncbi:MAG: hypothetical protein LBU09_00145 [Endomicrobium sp.]|nr:hypothetical protein [Endomicrobium sp.]